MSKPYLDVHLGRRTLLTCAAQLGTGALGFFSPVLWARDPLLGPLEERMFDLIVIGSGLAGLSAAIACAESGRSVLVLEKGPLIGGHSLYSSGSISAVSPERQRPLGIKDSVEQFVADAWHVGGECGDKSILFTIAVHSDEALRRLENAGIRLGPVFQAAAGLRARSFSVPNEASGRSYVLAYANRIRSLGMHVLLKHRVTAIRGKGGDFVVEAKRDTSDQSFFRARRVVIATGGFTANVRMRLACDPRLTAEIRTSANPRGLLWDGADGDGWALAESLGADFARGFGVQMLPIGGGRLLDYAGGDIYVDHTGQRFVNEAASRIELASAILDLPEKSFWVITDRQSRKNATLGPKLLNGIVQKSDTIENMASGMGINPAVLSTTLSEYNRNVRKGRDPVFGKTVFTQTIDEPPYYWGEEHVYVHTTLDGIRTDAQARVLDRNGDPIEGLFAAGEAVGGIFGKDRLGGTGLTCCLVMGRLAGLGL